MKSTKEQKQLARDLQKLAQDDLGITPKLRDCQALVNDEDMMPMEPREVYLCNMLQRWEGVLRESAKENQ